jgi:Kae1-associated kinase Bud32
MKKISEGAEACIYETTILKERAILKQRKPKSYRIRYLDEKIRASRTKKEARIMALASMLVKSPSLLLLGRHSIWMERINGKAMNEVKPSSAASRRRELKSIGAYLGRLHANGITHGDYTPANFMVDNNGDIWLIDFGLADMTVSFEERALDLLLMKRSIPGSEYRIVEREYLSSFSSGKEVLNCLAEIERRGRYQTRTLQTK